MLTVLDANAILRYLLRDIEAQACQVRDVIRDGAETTVEVLAEVVYVLGGVYGATRPEISQALKAMCDKVFVDRESEVLGAADLFAATKLDFVDCLLAARSRLTGQPVLTFDKKLAKLLNAASE